MSKKKANSTDDLINFLQDFIPNPEKVIKDTRAYLFKVGGEIISDLSSNPPWENKSGELNRSLSRGFEGPLSVSLSANAKYAKWLYNGTKRHFIKPENGDTLSWTFGWKRYYSKGHWVSGVWAGKRRNGRSNGTRSTPKNAKQLKWFEKRWEKKRTQAVKDIVKIMVKNSGF